MPFSRGDLRTISDEFGSGSPEYVLAHAWRQEQRGKKPSEPYLDITNPAKAVTAAFLDLERALYREANAEELRQMFEPRPEASVRDSSEMALFGELVGALSVGVNLFPAGDVEDFRRGAKTVPAEVTDARKVGEVVEFVQEGNPNSWFWKMPDGSVIANK